MKKLLTLAIALGSFNLAIAADNLSDDLDKNNTPAQIEEREEEVINSGDAVDMNTVPGTLEEREKEEQVESDFDQTDDPEKTYEYKDQELDE